MKSRLFIFAMGLLMAWGAQAQDTETSVNLDDVVDANQQIETQVEEDKKTTPLKRQGIEKVEVTGSHIRRTDIEGPSPVIVIDREKIEASGFDSVGQVLRGSTATPFGGSGATVNLRGLGSARTLVLINGHRAPKSGSSYTGGATSTNFVPLAAVERIEILKDGASATYGSDALGGVVNIITRKNIDGFAFATKYNQTGPNGGDQSRTSVAYASNSGRSTFLTSLQYTYTQGSRASDFFYLKGRPQSPIRSSNVIVSGKAYAGPNCTSINDSGLCSEDLDPQRITLPTQRVGNVTSWNYDVTSDTQVYATVVADYLNYGSQDPGATFSTPGVGSGLSFKGDELAAADWQGKLSKTGYKSGDPIRMFGRLDGSRQTIGNDLMGAVIVGSKGYWGQSDWTWDVNVNNQAYFEHERMGDQGLFQATRNAVAEGAYKPFVSGNNTTNITADSVVDSRYQVNWANLSSTGELGEFIGGNWASAVGVSAAHFEYADDRDDRVLNGSFMGLSGVEGNGERQLYAAYGELSGLFGKSFEAQLAVRNDTYSDFGSTTNPKLALRYQPLKSLMFRGSMGTGFKAPKLQDAYGAQLEGFFNGLVDIKKCQDTGDCDPDSFSARQGSNPDLKEETSVNYNVGFVVEPIRRFNISLDYWYAKVDGTISSGNVQRLLELEAQGVDVSKYGASVTRGDTGDIERIEVYLANIGTEEVDGVDVGMGYTFKTGVGDIYLGTEHTYLFHYFQSFYEEFGKQQILGQAGAPRWRNVTTLSYKLGNFNFRFVGRSTGRVEKQVRGTGFIEAFTQYDTSIDYALSSKSRLQLGALNIFNQHPPFDETNGSRIDGDLYNRFTTAYLTYRQDF